MYYITYIKIYILFCITLSLTIPLLQAPIKNSKFDLNCIKLYFIDLIVLYIYIEIKQTLLISYVNKLKNKNSKAFDSSFLIEYTLAILVLHKSIVFLRNVLKCSYTYLLLIE